MGFDFLCCNNCGGELDFSKAGFCRCACGACYPVKGRLVNFLEQSNEHEKGVEDAASFRWNNSMRMEQDQIFVEHELADFIKRHGFGDKDGLRHYLKDVNIIAEIGAGEGRLVDFYLRFSEAHIYALELSDSVYYLEEKYRDNPRVTVLKSDAGKHPFKPQSIDLLSCDQSIHHSKDPKAIFDALIKSLKLGGKALVCVFAQKSPVREKMDSIIRDAASCKSPQEVMEIADKFTQIGKLLYETDLEVTIPESFSEFGTMAGQTMSLQRFFYYGIFKCFWNREFSFEKSLEYNHDWYCYPICYKATAEEIVNWFVGNGLHIESVDFNFANNNVRGYLSR